MVQEIFYKEVKADLSQSLIEDYALNNVVIIETPYLDSIFLCIVCIETESQLDELWDAINSVISSELSKEFKTDFQMWNFYLFFLCKESISTALKYEIVNDKFSSRKVVLDSYDEEADSQVIKKIISEFILGNDISLEGRKDLPVDKGVYKSDSIVFKNIEQHYLKSKGKSNDKELLNEMLINIISELKDEN